MSGVGVGPHAIRKSRALRAEEKVGCGRRIPVKAFAYVNATSEKDAVAALKFDGIALPLAGGQDLLARMKDYIDTPERVVNIKNALDATATPTPDGGMRIGAAMKIVDLLEQAPIARMYPAVIA